MNKVKNPGYSNILSLFINKIIQVFISLFTNKIAQEASHKERLTQPYGQLSYPRAG